MACCTAFVRRMACCTAFVRCFFRHLLAKLDSSETCHRAGYRLSNTTRGKQKMWHITARPIHLKPDRWVTQDLKVKEF